MRGNNWLRIFANTLLAVALVVSCGPAFAAEFKATMSVRWPENTRSHLISVKGLKFRWDSTFEGKQGVVIVDQERGLVQILDVEKRTYQQEPIEGSLEALIDLRVRIKDAPSWLGTPKPVGTETIGGYLCEKFEFPASGQSRPVTYWVSRKLEYPLKFFEPFNNSVMVTEVTNIREGPVEDSVFQVPSGYTLDKASAAPPQ